MLDKKNIIQSEERAVLVGVVQKDQTEQQMIELLP
jgi:GTPase